MVSLIIHGVFKCGWKSHSDLTLAKSEFSHRLGSTSHSSSWLKRRGRICSKRKTHTQIEKVIRVAVVIRVCAVSNQSKVLIFDHSWSEEAHHTSIATAKMTIRDRFCFFQTTLFAMTLDTGNRVLVSGLFFYCLFYIHFCFLWCAHGTVVSKSLHDPNTATKCRQQTHNCINFCARV